MDRFSFRKLSPNQSRVIYDTLVCLLAYLFVAFYSRYTFSHSVSALFLLTPIFLNFFNLILGIYSHFRVGSGFVKTPILTLSIFLVALSTWLLSGDSSSVALWTALVWAPIVLPRIFLNFNTRNKASFISAAVRNKGPVLVVGGGGYIGTHVLELLLKEGFHIRLLDKFVYSKEVLKDLTQGSRIEVVTGDMTDIMALTNAMTGVSAIIHLAGLVGDPACAVDPAFTRHTNVIATRMLKEVAISMGVPRFIFASSCSVYGASDEEVDEGSRLNPVSLYAQTKIDSERELLSLIDETFCVTILRFATVFGHSRRPRFDLVGNLFTAQAFHEGKITVTGENQWRPFVHVRDLARAVVMTLKAPEEVVRGQTFNVGDVKLNLTIGELAKQVKKVADKYKTVAISVNNDVTDRRNYMVSFKKIQRILGFEASTNIEDGVKEMFEHFQLGTYHDYKDAIYSNLEMTRRAVVDFRDPVLSSRLYGPIVEEAPNLRAVV